MRQGKGFMSPRIISKSLLLLCQARGRAYEWHYYGDGSHKIKSNCCDNTPACDVIGAIEAHGGG